MDWFLYDWDLRHERGLSILIELLIAKIMTSLVVLRDMYRFNAIIQKVTDIKLKL